MVCEHCGHEIEEDSYSKEFIEFLNKPEEELKLGERIARQRYFEYIVELTKPLKFGKIESAKADEGEKQTISFKKFDGKWNL